MAFKRVCTAVDSRHQRMIAPMNVGLEDVLQHETAFATNVGFLCLYVDCRKTFVEGCDLLTKPKMEDHRAMLLVQSHWGEGDQLSRGSVYLEEYFGRDEDAAIMTKMSPIYIDKDVGGETAFATNVGFLCLYAFVHAFLFLVFSWLGLQISLVFLSQFTFHLLDIIEEYPKVVIHFHNHDVRLSLRNKHFRNRRFSTLAQ